MSVYTPNEYAIQRLLRTLSDRDEHTGHTIASLCHRYRLSEGDLEYARECASGPGVKSPVRVAIATLRKRGEAK